ncbi:hypothetical protein BKA66DRAFT_447540 [Pyrenochaeta sp. MPI-SDFR-AT-0127]|nr:hypothetical protein BKA66DRAFT_447540 [Pyrenochaeta sp. MPI-SDFR-AT-0127]
MRCPRSFRPTTVSHAPFLGPIVFLLGVIQRNLFKCGDNTYTGHEIYLAAQRGTNLYHVSKTRGRKKYLRAFPNDDSKGNKLSFPKECPADDSRYEFPLMNGSPYDGGPYDGGKNNVKQGDERVVYY